MRRNLKEARLKAGLTQKEVAQVLNINMRNYRRIESGETVGTVAEWDTLEDLFGIHQRILRQQTDS